ncbi:MAG: Tex family protein [Bacteroidota bacterium]
MNTTYVSLIARQLQLRPQQVEAVLNLLSEGATVPFISRYRKERTGSLDEVQVGDIQREEKRLQQIDKRRVSILSSIEEQEKLTDDLRQRIERSWDLTELEDLYLPYKRKRKTRASAAREKGLEPLAKMLLQQRHQDIEQLASKYLNDEVEDIETALQGARDIIAEQVNEDEKARTKIRQSFKRYATVQAKVARGKSEEAAVYKDYFDFDEPLKRIPSHRLLAILRAESQGLLRVKIAPDEEAAIEQLEYIFVRGNSDASRQVFMAVQDAYKRLLAPSIETEFRKIAKEKADAEAITVFADNLRQLLLAAPLGQKRVLGIDPGFRTGCKVVVLNENGDLLHNTTIYPHPPQRQSEDAKYNIQQLVDRYQIEAIAIGNGTAGRETLALCQSINFDRPIACFSINEAGASIYSASEVARQEFPNQDVTVRGAVSIGRRLMDPLAELVKIDAKSIGVGQYQHDVNQVQLKDSLDRTVESCVNSVGINLNTASQHLLTYVSGLGPSLAQNIVDYRSENGAFPSRTALKKVPRMGAKSFEQAAGFLRIREAKNPLDNTAVHPERYALVQQMAKDLGVSVQALIDDQSLRQRIDIQRYVSDEVGLPTLKDILKELDKPGLDPRGEVQAFEFARHIQTMDDLNIGMVLPGIVTNLTNFGAFVDIGIKENGLVHISEIVNRFIKSPSEVLKLNQQVQVKVIDIDEKRGRVALSMKQV